MSIQYQSAYVDEKYLPIVEPNLYTDTVLIPEVTFTSKYETGPAGQLFVHKVGKGTAVAVGVPGRDFTDEGASDTLVPIALNNNYQKSKKIYGVQANAVAYNIADENLSTALAMCRESRQYSGLACLAKEGTASSNTTAITTSAGAVSELLALRKAIKDAHGKANFALVNTEIYRLLLAEVGFTVASDPATRSAELMNRFGLAIIECNSFDNATAKYYNSSGTLVTVDLTDVEMIVGDYNAFSVVDNLEVIRLKDSENFAGTKAQVEINSGFKVTNADCVAVKAIASL